MISEEVILWYDPKTGKPTAAGELHSFAMFFMELPGHMLLRARCRLGRGHLDDYDHNGPPIANLWGPWYACARCGRYTQHPHTSWAPAL